MLIKQDEAVVGVNDPDFAIVMRRCRYISARLAVVTHQTDGRILTISLTIVIVKPNLDAYSPLLVKNADIWFLTFIKPYRDTHCAVCP